MGITVIGEAIAVVLSSWKSGSPVLENVVNVIFALGKVVGLGSSPFVQAAFKFATEAENAIADLGTSGYAIAGEDTINGKTYSVVVVDNASAVGAQFGLNTAGQAPPQS